MATLNQSLEPTTAPAVSPVQSVVRGLASFLRQMAQRPLGFAGMVLVLVFAVLAVFGPMVAPFGYDDVLRGEDRRALKNMPPSAEHIMGTDNLGRDVFSRVLTGARDTIGLPAISTAIAVAIGTVIGLATGYIGGWFDEIVSRGLDSLLAIPALVLALVMLTTIVPTLNNLDSPFVESIGANNISITLVIVLLYVPIVTRVIRSATLGIRSAGYVEIAKLRGESTLYIMFREILPGVLPALAVEASLRFSYAIFLVASLGFLGLGVQPPSAEWGRMVLDARGQVEIAPWSLWYPAAAIAILIISVNLMADGLRRVFRYDE
ncbi:MAG: ABC transporter permease [Anaerolineae bacterium]